MAALFPKYIVRDRYLPDADAQALLDHALVNEAAFGSAKVTKAGASDVVKEERDGLMHAPPDALVAAFRTHMERDFEQLCREVGMKPFVLHSLELYMTAHGDGGFFNEHIDTMTAQSRAITDSDRVVSLILYLHRKPKAFSGGELVIKGFVGDPPPVEVEPLHNRLVAFPSIAPHGVARVNVPSRAFADSRFALNCCFRRAKG